MKENDHTDVKFMHNAFSVHNAFYVLMDRFRGNQIANSCHQVGKKKKANMAAR